MQSAFALQSETVILHDVSRRPSGAMNEKFGKGYKLCSQKAIAELFGRDQKVKNYPFLMHYATMELPDAERFQVVISAPKRTFRKAHERNRIKRLCREGLRRNKHSLEKLLAERGEQLALFLIYTAKEEMPYLQMEKKMVQLLQKLMSEITQRNEATHD